jgi:integrase
VRVLAPLRACLADAHRNEDIATNPALGLRVRRRPRVIEDDGDPLKVLTRTELAALIEATHPHWRVLIELLAGTGLRINEALALRWIDLDLGNRPTVHVVRAIKGKTMQIGPPKSRTGRRRVPLPASVAQDLRLRRAEAEWSSDDDPAFPNAQGGLMDDGNLRRRILTSAARAVGVPWCGFHTLRHGFGSMLFAERRNIRQVSRLLGHSDPSFTLSVYVHLLDGDVGGPLDLDAALGREPVDEAVAGVQ